MKTTIMNDGVTLIPRQRERERERERDYGSGVRAKLGEAINMEGVAADNSRQDEEG